MNKTQLGKDFQNYYGNIILLGPQGSGKGTLLPFLTILLNLNALGTGDMLRAIVAKGTKEGIKIKKYMDSGAHVPDEYVVASVVNTLRNPTNGRYGVIDGFPRNIMQYNAIRSYISTLIHLNLSDDECMERGLGRVLDEETGEIFNYKKNPEGIQGLVLDDKGSFVSGYSMITGNKLIVRSDDTREGLEKRIELYHSTTEPIINEFDGTLINLDVSKTPKAIQEQLYQKIMLVFNNTHC